MTRKYSIIILTALILPLSACVSMEDRISQERQVPEAVPTDEELAILRNVQFPSDSEKSSTLISEDNLVDEQQYHGYTVRIYKDRVLGREGYFEISKDGSLLFSQEGGVFRVGLVHEEIPDDTLVKMGSDITDDGIPDLVVSEKSKDPNSIFIFYVFSIGKEFKLLDKIDAGPDEWARFKDVDRDGAIEFYYHDLTFSYWHANLTASPKPKIIFELKDGKYILAMEGMQKRAPDADDIQAKVDKVHARIEEIRTGIEEKGRQEGIDELYYSAWIKDDTIIPLEVWGYMLELIFSGHYKLAWEFLDKAWPQNKPGKEEFILEFKMQLSQSRYWEEIAKRI